ncbi:MAG TPA: hypothetical protein VHX61_07730 [Rhizomicrobium sp.]|jgi:hypothetical protein|nr:hypothetical protein [Rhizomicrobium sp.]
MGPRASYFCTSGSLAARFSRAIFHDAGEFMLGLQRAEPFAQLVRQHECGPVVAFHFATQMQCRMSFDAVHENRDHVDDVPHGHLSARERGACGRGELLLARLALEDAAADVVVNRGAFATVGALPLSSIGLVAKADVRRISLVFAQVPRFPKAERLGFGRQEEVLAQCAPFRESSR